MGSSRERYVTPEFTPVLYDFGFVKENFRPLNETKTVKDGSKFGCYKIASETKVSKMR